jgi:DNA-binding sugar fermentation-stimulating protein
LLRQVLEISVLVNRIVAETLEAECKNNVIAFNDDLAMRNQEHLENLKQLTEESRRLLIAISEEKESKESQPRSRFGMFMGR